MPEHHEPAPESPDYAELHCLSNFSFLRGASHPEELVERAQALGYQAIAMTDECSVSGVVRAHEQAKKSNLQLIVGSRMRLTDGPELVILATSKAGYARLCRLITRGRRDSAKGEYALARADLDEGLQDCLLLCVPPADVRLDAEQLRWLGEQFAGRVWLSVELTRDGLDRQRLQRLDVLSRRFAIPLVAGGGVCMHARGRRPLHDLLAAIRLNRPVAELGYTLMQNGERHLRRREELAGLYPPRLLAETLVIAERCRFSLDEIKYQYPDDVTPVGRTPGQFLRELTEQGVQRRWPDGEPHKVRAQIEHEMHLIAELQYEAYFLTVWDIVRFARARGILCQGRGSAANSAVCYALGITEVDPARMNLLFERFISRERGEPPDIDVDFEHQRREEVIQYIYEKYGRERAALTACVITYRPKSALRDTAKALGMGAEAIETLVATVSGWRRWGEIQPEYLAEAGLKPDNPLLHRVLTLANMLLGFPRHLSQHVGGFVIARDRLTDLVPVENAAMEGRTVIQWEKDDLETLGLLKVDVLALGMLSVIRRALHLIQSYEPSLRDLAAIPAEDPAVYEMIQRADTVGVFQIESRGQMSMLPRLRPKNFYDLVIEIAIVRPGPIQGDMVHPYLRRRNGLEPVTFPSPEVASVLARTLGVPIFQEQVIKLAMVAAGFTPGEADQLRRSMAAWKRRGGLEPYREKLLNGMRERGYATEFAERIYQQILGFGDYGFPESHSASFALLAYASAWLKRHHPAAFCAALINSQPMGFYAPAQLVRDAREHGVEVRPVDVCHSDWNCTLEEPGPSPALRLGLRLVEGLSEAGAQRLERARRQAPFSSLDDLSARCSLNRRDLQALARADALAGLSGDRHQAFWEVAGQEKALPLLQQPDFDETRPNLPEPDLGRQVLADYAHLGLSLREHPLALLREQLAGLRCLSAAEVALRPAGAGVWVAGLVLIRQRPGNGNAVFVTIEDETGTLNLIVWRDLAERQRKILLQAKLLVAWAEIQRADGVQHLICKRLADRTGLLGGLAVSSRDFQ